MRGFFSDIYLSSLAVESRRPFERAPKRGSRDSPFDSDVSVDNLTAAFKSKIYIVFAIPFYMPCVFIVIPFKKLRLITVDIYHFMKSNGVFDGMVKLLRIPAYPGGFYTKSDRYMNLCLLHLKQAGILSLPG